MNININILVLLFAIVMANICYAGEFLNCDASGIEYYAGYSVDLANSLRTELSDDIEIPTRMKNYKIGISKYDDLLRIRLTDKRNGYQVAIALGDYQSYHKVYLITQISKAEMEENNLFSEFIQVRCFKTNFLPPSYKVIK